MSKPNISPNARFKGALLKPKHWGSWLYVGVFFCLAYLPTALRHRLAERFAYWIYARNTKRRQVVIANLTQVSQAHKQHNKQQQMFIDKKMANVGAEVDIESMAKQHFVWHYKGLFDYSRLFFRSPRYLQRQTQLVGGEQIEQAIHNKRNVIVLLAHSVWLDFAPIALSENFLVYGSYHAQKNPVLDWLMARARQQHVDQLIAREEGMSRLVRSLQPGNVMIFLPDEDLGLDHACFAPYFGVKKATLTTPIRMSKLKNALCVPAFAWFNVETSRCEVTLGKAFEFDHQLSHEKNSEQMNQALESVIKQEPLQYMWTMKWFKTTVKGKKSIY